MFVPPCGVRVCSLRAFPFSLLTGKGGPVPLFFCDFSSRVLCFSKRLSRTSIRSNWAAAATDEGKKFCSSCRPLERGRPHRAVARVDIELSVNHRQGISFGMDESQLLDHRASLSTIGRLQR